jgi:CRISPR/Cas system CMR subunit Cmr4 (Cas7 group RAMP superfamily)
MNTRIGAIDYRLSNVEGTLVQVHSTVRELADQHWTLTNVVKRVVERQDESISDLRERVTRIETKRDEDE